MDQDGQVGELVIRRTIDFRSAEGPTKIGNYYAGGKRFDVNGSTIEGGEGLHFWIADTQDRVKPGEARGQEFVVYTFAGEPHAAAGLTAANNTEYGVKLSRSNIAIRPQRGFNEGAWCGNWTVGCDGMRGVLSLASVAPVSGSFRTDRGETFTVKGSLKAAHPHRLDLQVVTADGERPMRLAFHNQESDVFSGTASWNGGYFGVSGARRAA